METKTKAIKYAKIVLKESLLLLVEIAFLMMTFSLLWAINNYGGITVDEIIFHISMPIAGTAGHILNSYFNYIMRTVPVLTIISLLWRCMYWKATTENSAFGNKIVTINKSMRKHALKLFAVWFTVLALIANSSFGLFKWVGSKFTESNFIEMEYVDPKATNITFPDNKRNLICIYVESGETTNQDVTNGGAWSENYIREMTDLANNNISFSHSDLLEGAMEAPGCGWTIAALVAQTSGLPLKLYESNVADPHNSMSEYDCFLPGATTLGDILESQGYRNYFMAGSDFKFGGRTNYFTNHGNYTIFDYYTAKRENVIPSDYYVWWGFEDKVLYSWAKEKLINIAADEQPFNFSMLTVDTHHENGYVCDLCENNYDNQYANVWSCASKQLNEFIEWCKEQDFHENTTIVIVGDHYSMDSDFYDDLELNDDRTTQRKIYNCFINSAIEPTREKDRQFTTLDMFPTVLASIGATIDGDRLGLGTNLFSNEKTLAEEFGYDYMFSELEQKSSFYNNELLYP